MIVWDGTDGAVYNPDVDEWRWIPRSPLRPRYGHSAVWTGAEMLIWGGNEAGCGDCFLADGAAYDPATDRWQRLPDGPLAGRDRHTAVWTGEQMLIWGGCCFGDRYFADGALFDPSR